MNKKTRLVLILTLAPQLAAAQGLMDMVRAQNYEVPSAGPGAAVMPAAFKRVPNPAYADPDDAPPPNLQAQQIQTLIKKMVEAELSSMAKPDLEKVTLTTQDVQRLAGNLISIDRNYVDTIPTEVWDKAVADMGGTAAKEFKASKNWETTVTAMVKTGTKNMLDPFSAYWDKDEVKRHQDSMRNSFVGIGAILKPDGIIDILIPGGPAEKAGLMAGDKIVNVDGTPVKNSEEVIKKTLGTAGVPANVQVVRKGQTLAPIKIVRAAVQTKNVYSKQVQPGVGYVYLGQFSPDCDAEIIAAVGQLREKGAKKLIIDVRNNPGGTVDSVSSILSEFTKNGQPLVRFKNHGKVMYENVTDGNGKFLGMPLAILINDGSASASEILAGAVQDVLGPVIVGSRSYGKGTMQQVSPDRDGRALKLTIGRWYTPRDRSIDAQHDPKTRERIKGTGGVVPDHLIVLTEEQEQAVMKQLFREVQGAAPDGPAVADPVLAKALEILR